MAAGLSGIQSALAGLSPRERTLLLSLAGVFLSLALLGFWIWSGRRLDAIEQERADTVDALRLIQRARPRIAARNHRREALLARYRTRAPALTSFVEAQARLAEVQVAEAQDRPVTPVGRRFVERSVSIRLRQVSLEALTEFMDHIDSAEFPVAITAIRIRRRFGEANRYDIDDMVISTWDQAPAGSTTGTRRTNTNNGENSRANTQGSEENRR